MKEFFDILEKHEITNWGLVNEPRALTYEHYQTWLNKGHNGVLSYLEGERADKRESLKNYFEEFQSAIVIAFDYSRVAKVSKDFYNSEKSNGLKIANYVFAFDGIDYHFYLRDKLSNLAEDLKKILPEVEIKHSLDTQPVLERDLGQRAGLGWFGKNSMLISKDIGSYFILGSLFFSINLEDLGIKKAETQTDHCGKCTRCIDLCPTDAIDPKTRTLIANKCISTFTIELFKDAPAPLGYEKSSGEIYGCDICQDVCPWNMRVQRQSSEVQDSERDNFLKNNSILVEKLLTRPIEKIIEGLESISNREYRRNMGQTPLGRTGRVGMLKNLKAYLKKD